jgi:CsoR family transcriptional regulator, copper-sensing transcriptional repressor
MAGIYDASGHTIPGYSIYGSSQGQNNGCSFSGKRSPMKPTDQSNPTAARIFPSHADQLERLGKIEGQIKGIRKMIEDRRYCMDILPQIKAVHGALRQVELGVLETHVNHCVHDAVESRDPAAAKAKIDEVMRALSRIE